MKKIVLYNDGRYPTEDDTTLILDYNDIEEKVSLDDTNFIVEGLPINKEIEDKIRALSSEIKECDEPEEVEEILKREFPEVSFSVKYAPESIEANEEVYILPYKEEFKESYFLVLADCEKWKVYTYWNGHNWQEIWLEEYQMNEIVYDETEKEDLDDWDGSNWYYGRKYHHGLIYPVVEIEGNKPTEPTYLLYTYDQFQGSLDKGKLITEQERQEILASLGE